MQETNSSLTFVVRRHAPELIAPASPTPREVKLLSDMDDQVGLRFQIPSIHFYPRDPKMGNTNPASVIRDALAKVLVFYYPLAGRLKEGPGGKLMVDCTGEGVLYIEAEADVTLEQFGKTLEPPFPCMDVLLYDVPGSDAIVGTPLLLIQVTRLLCGGFIFAVRVNHTMFDGEGVVQFLMALGEMAQGALAPSILPVWQRELLIARDPPCVTFPHPEYEEVENIKSNIITMDHEMTKKSFFIGPTELSALRKFVPDNLKSCSTFDLLTACLWRCRTIALQPNPEEVMRLIFFVYVRDIFNPPLVGYYGNCVIIPCVTSTARDLCNNTLGHALELIMKAKSTISEEYVRSTLDLMVVKGRPRFQTASTYIAAALTVNGFDKIDFGWGKPIYAGIAKNDEIISGAFSYYLPCTNDNGESGTKVILALPTPTMEKFVKELNIMLT